MQRIEAMAAIYPTLEQHIVVTNMGAVAVELFSLGHRPNFFYLEHSMGLASSVISPPSVCQGSCSPISPWRNSTVYRC